MLGSHEEILPEDVDEEEGNRILKKVANEIVSRRLTAPALFFLESCSPLSFVGSQAMIVLEPFIHAIFNLPDYRKFTLMMERRENIRKLMMIIEDANQEQKTARKEAQQSAKKERGRRWLRRRSR